MDARNRVGVIVFRLYSGWIISLFFPPKEDLKKKNQQTTISQLQFDLWFRERWAGEQCSVVSLEVFPLCFHLPSSFSNKRIGNKLPSSQGCGPPCCLSPIQALFPTSLNFCLQTVCSLYGGGGLEQTTLTETCSSKLLLCLLRCKHFKSNSV